VSRGEVAASAPRSTKGLVQHALMLLSAKNYPTRSTKSALFSLEGSQATQKGASRTIDPPGAGVGAVVVAGLAGALEAPLGGGCSRALLGTGLGSGRAPAVALSPLISRGRRGGGGSGVALGTSA